MTGTVFNIQRFTVHDGPGIRTEVFLKGCTLACKWCSNPESLKSYKEIGVYKTKCIGKDHCGLCEKACKNGAILREEHGFTVGIDREKCKRCYACADACPAGALKLWGKDMTVEEVMTEILADRDLIFRSGGGVTISGGESLLQVDFTTEILKKCREEKIHTCVETALNVPKESVLQAIPYTDMFIFDLKEMNSEKHKSFCGAGNERILENAKIIAESGIPYVIRLPYVPGHTGTAENLSAMRDFILNELKEKPAQIQLLQFRTLGEEKYVSLGLPYLMKGPEKEELEKEIHNAVDFLASAGLPAVAGSTKPINKRR